MNRGGAQPVSLRQGHPPQVLRGAIPVARQAVLFARGAGEARLAVVNGSPGVIVGPHARPRVAKGFTVPSRTIVEIDIVDHGRLLAVSLPRQR